jgi:peroxiredoxin Q/BCP
MVSLDDPERNRAFADSVGAGFVLLSDPAKHAAERYGVLAMGGLYARRITFYIGADGRIVRIDRDVDPETHGQDVLRSLDELGFPKKTASEEPAAG